MNMIVRQLFDGDTWTYTYLLADPHTRQAVLIDPVFEQYLRGLAMVHRAELNFVDVREPAEIEASSLGMITGAVNIPLGVLGARKDEIPKSQPVITVCPAGARSAQAAHILEKAGFERVANLPGGHFNWQALGYPLESNNR